MLLLSPIYLKQVPLAGNYGNHLPNDLSLIALNSEPSFH
jgi:hypothetical protein